MMNRRSTPLFALFFLCLTGAARGEVADSTAVPIDRVVVTSTRTDPARTEVARGGVPLTVSVVGRERIEATGESALLPVLSGRVPGLFVTERGVTGFGVSAGASGGITVRGVGGAPTTGVLVLIDGHPQYMGLMGHPLADAYAAADVERVEVVRGPASVLYGSGAMGGAINIVSRRQTAEGWSASGRAMAGSYGTQKYTAGAGLRHGPFDLRLSVGHDRTDGHRPDAGFRSTNASARAGYRLGERLSVWGEAGVAAYETQNPGTVARPMIDNVADILRGSASAALVRRGPRGEGALKLFYNFGDHRIDEGYAASEAPRDVHFRSDDRHYGANLYHSFRPLAGMTLTAGLDANLFGGRARNHTPDGSAPEVPLVDTAMYELAGYVVVDQWIGDRLSLNGGLRAEHHKAWGSRWVPSVGLTWNAGETLVKATVSGGFRSPTLREMFLWGGHNPALEPERMTSYELSLLRSTMMGGRLSVELTGFVAEGTNIIQTEGTLLQNTGAFTHSGVEAAIHLRPAAAWDIEGTYSYLHLKKPVLYAPGHQAFLSVAWRPGRWSLGASGRWVDGLYTALIPAAVTERYLLVDARVAFEAAPRLDLFVMGENLTDRPYEIMHGYPMPGATVMAGVSFAIDGLSRRP